MRSSSSLGIGYYDHLNRNDDMRPKIKIGGMTIHLDIEEVAKATVEANYGVHRLLSAIVRARRAALREDGRNDTPDNHELLDEIERLLEHHY